MVGDTVVLLTVRADLVAAHPGANLISTLSVSGVLHFRLPDVFDLGRQDLESQRLALRLGSHVDADGDPGRLVRRRDAAFSFVPVLAPGTGTPAWNGFHFVLAELKGMLLLGIENGNCDGRRLNPASFLCRRDPLKSVPAGFVREEPLGSLAREEGRNETWPLL